MTLTLNEELQWLGILGKTQLDDDIKSDKAGATSTSRDFEFLKPFFSKIAFVNQSALHTDTTILCTKKNI